MGIADIKEKLNKQGKAVFHVKVSPGSNVTEWQESLSDGTLKMKVKEAPERGKANEAVVNFVAETFLVSKKAVSIIAGGGARLKRIKIKKV
ncbi:MAG: DUF167 domain-containing protein [Patescibacteria group bacterium]|jgi:uncharacterized protein YggU (UPF0235/DUF167 family)|nr:DUF167 domain-containing protein [Patescibacteria group bacterium]